VPGTPTPERGYTTLAGSDFGNQIDNLVNAALAAIDGDVQALYDLVDALIAGTSWQAQVRVQNAAGASVLLKDPDATAGQRVMRLMTVNGTTSLVALNDAETTVQHTFLTFGHDSGEITFKPGTIEQGALAFDVATQAELDAGLATKSSLGHTHDDRYFTESEVTALLVPPTRTQLGSTGVYYYKHLGRVWLEGQTPTPDETGSIGQLPSGFRPAHTAYFGAATNTDQGSPAGVLMKRVSVDTNGYVQVQSGGGPTIYFDQISFRHS
jgi:hypothetical protein